MTRASEAADGALVNAIAYQDEYNTVRAFHSVAPTPWSSNMKLISSWHELVG
jgi:hypothetical protein